jgi:hypothetical protein
LRCCFFPFVAERIDGDNVRFSVRSRILRNGDPLLYMFQMCASGPAEGLRHLCQMEDMGFRFLPSLQAVFERLLSGEAIGGFGIGFSRSALAAGIERPGRSQDEKASRSQTTPGRRCGRHASKAVPAEEQTGQEGVGDAVDGLFGNKKQALASKHRI